MFFVCLAAETPEASGTRDVLTIEKNAKILASGTLKNIFYLLL